MGIQDNWSSSKSHGAVNGCFSVMSEERLENIILIFDLLLYICLTSKATVLCSPLCILKK
jgi:hypothetical protein